MAAAVKEMEKQVQDNERVARLESHVEHIQADATDIKANLRKLNDKIDTEVQKLSDKIDTEMRKLHEKIDTEVRKLNDKIDTEVRRLNEKIDALKDVVTDFKAEFRERFAQLDARFAKLEMSRALDRVWWLLIAASLLGVMARGFKWI